MTPTRPDPIAFMTGALDPGSQRPRAITAPESGGKFTPEGTAIAFAGNTILCHVERASLAHAALSEMQREMRASRFGADFAFLPPESFHMTVFQGISPDCRSWPEGIARDTSRDAVTEQFCARLGAQDFPARRRMRATGLWCGHSVTMAGADPTEEARIRATRVSLRAATGLRPDHFDSYVFHITLGYPLRWLDAGEASALADLSQEIFARHGGALQQVDFGPLELCDFETMLHFEPRLLLGQSRGA